tara:strand:+ start:433 stop:579 length:147 start_codon:yes stop_codon:yes gene_type:complete
MTYIRLVGRGEGGRGEEIGRGWGEIDRIIPEILGGERYDGLDRSEMNR